jgi:YidC/Oxa1 family membrane protein insertase
MEWMQILETVLSPLIGLMKWILGFYISLISSTGLSILLLSVTFALLLFPLQRAANRLEQRIGKTVKIVDKEVKALRGKLKGEDLFLETERIYKMNGWHPIYSLGMGASFFVMLPVLISAILLFSGAETLSGKEFLFIGDLSKPDGLLGPVNVLPILMSAVTIIDAKFRFKNDKESQRRFFLIAILLLAIVYRFPSGLVLYWTGSNVMSFIISRINA